MLMGLSVVYWRRCDLCRDCCCAVVERNLIARGVGKGFNARGRPLLFLPQGE